MPNKRKAVYSKEYFEELATPTTLEVRYQRCQRCGRIRMVNEARTTELCDQCKHVDDNKAEVLKTDEDLTPCYKAREFWALETWSEELLDCIPVSQVRNERLDHIESVANERFCGDCPFKQECLAWGEDEEYTGIAGGVWLSGGVRPKRGATAPTGVRFCECHGERMTWWRNSRAPSGGEYRCSVKTREKAKARRARKKAQRAELEAA